MSDQKLKDKLYHVIFESETTAGKIFDIGLLTCICASVLLIILESVYRLKVHYGHIFYTIEWVVIILFSIEYCARLYCVKNKSKYIFSFYGVIDLLAILPFYLAIAFPVLHFLSIVRILRLLRIFRIFKLVRFLEAGDMLVLSIWKSRRKIALFLFFVLILNVILGSIMYVIESPHNQGFNNIPQSIYWAIVTLTTVGYGDVSPITNIGKMLASVIMMLGYAIIAVPTGIVTAQIINANKNETTRRCKHCLKQGHDSDAVYCKYCGYKL